MTITAASLSGGFPDPDATGLEPPGSTLNAVYEYTNFVDQITVDLTNADPMLPAYTSLDNLVATVSIEGTPITLNELTGNGNVSLNVAYSSPNTNTVSTLTIFTNIESANTVGNIYITGNIQNAFPDKYWEYVDFTNNISSVVSSTSSIPNADVGLFTYKPSFMRYVNITFNVTATFDTGTETKSIPKKVVNDWEINRIALLAQIAREEAYRSNNYPKAY